MDREKVIKAYEDFVNGYECFCTSDDYEYEMHKAVLAMLKEQDNCENCAIAIEDRQPIVRCKDCKNNNQCSIQFKFADADNPGNWFCAYGKSK